MMDQRQPFVNVVTITHPLWAIAADIQDVRSAARVEAIQTITFVDDIGNVEIQTYYFMPTCTERPDWVFEDDVEGLYNSEEEAKAKLTEQPTQQNPNVFQ